MTQIKGLIWISVVIMVIWQVNAATKPFRMMAAQSLHTYDVKHRTVRAIQPPMLSDSYLPAVMQAVAYYVEMLQYEVIEMTTVEPPFTLAALTDDFTQPKPQTPSAANKIPVSTTTPTTVVTTRRSTSSTEATIFAATSSHRPGYFAPQPAVQEGVMTEVEQHIDGSPPAVDRPATVKPPSSLGVLPLLSISSDQFFSWFLQMKDKHISQASEYDLQFLHQLPAGLLQDILHERYEQPAFLDTDNVDEFLKVYDDFYGRNHPVTGRKKIPPTKPYVQMLMLYDLLKREAKRLMLNKFEGYSARMLTELNATSKASAERQLYMLMKRMLDRLDVEKADIVARCKSIMEDLVNPNTITAKALRYIPPLAFEQ